MRCDFILLGSKITADGDCSHEIKRCILLGRKVMTNLDSILKSRDTTLSTKVCLVKAMVFPVVTYGHESWAIKKAEHQRIDVFEQWCWRRLLWVPWTARRSSQSILKEISPGCSLEGLMLKLKLQSFGHLMQRTDSFEKTLMLGKMKVGEEGDNRWWDDWMASPIQWTRVWVNARSWWWTGMLGMLQSMGSRLHWTELNIVDSTDEPTLTPHNHPESIVYIVVLFVSYILWSWQVYNDMIHHYGIISVEYYQNRSLLCSHLPGKAMKLLFPTFTQNSVFEIWFHTRTQRLSFQHHHLIFITQPNSPYIRVQFRSTYFLLLLHLFSFPFIQDIPQSFILFHDI